MASCLLLAGASRGPCLLLCQHSQRAAEDAELPARWSRCLFGEASAGLGFLRAPHAKLVPLVGMLALR